MEDPDGSLLAYCILLALLILINAFFSMSEIAIISLNDSKVRKQAREGHRKARRLAAMIDNPTSFLATIQVGVTFSGFLASALAAHAFARRLGAFLAAAVPALSGPVAGGAALVIITLLLSYLSLVLGELVPKRMALQYFEKIAMAASGPLSVVFRLEKPFVAMLSLSTNGILRLLGIDPDHRPETVTEEEIRMMIDVGNESGSIEESDKDMINNIFELDDRTVSELMTHRTEVTAIAADTPLDEIITIAVESGYSRIPVYENDLDSILGILYVKDLLELIRRERDETGFSLSRYLREPLYVPEAAKGKSLLTELQQKKLQMAVVVDEYGGTSGIVTMEDLLESIVGNIQDEYDDEEEDITPLGADCYKVDGLTSLDDISRFFNLVIPEEDDFDTIGGYAVAQLGHIPEAGELSQVAIGPVLFTVTAVDDRRITTLEAKLQQEPAPLPDELGLGNALRDER